MTWSIQLNGHDDLSDEEKEELEKMLVDEARDFAGSLVGLEGNKVTSAVAVTNTTGSVNLLEEAS